MILTPEEGEVLPTLNKVVVQSDNPFRRELGRAVFVNDSDPNNPDFIYYPTAENIGDGETFSLNSNNMGITDFYSPYYAFRDGVISMDAYASWESISAEGTQGNNFLKVTSGALDVIEQYSAVIVNSEVYHIDKTQYTNADTLIFLMEDLLTDVDSVELAIRDNVKLWNNVRTKKTIAELVSAISLNNPKRKIFVDLEQAVLKVIRNDIASKILFQNKEYDRSEYLLKENLKIADRYGIDTNS